jgi:hypothetical protein
MEDILRPFGIFLWPFGIFMAFWYILWPFGRFFHALVRCPKKNLAALRGIIKMATVATTTYCG